MILIDTHILVWTVQADASRIGKLARELMDAAATSHALHVSVITLWEIALLVQHGRLALGRDVWEWTEQTLALPGINLMPLEPAIAVNSVRLPGEIHRDPADRFLIATARHLGVPLMTIDEKILAYGAAGHVQTIDASR
ncbi:type II toxin-antitoxin system VapC family toxin [Inquilinus sp. OTU3971]|uniref:type II toxin-antitoxin system VapC family toxin n=1 Tax=Inquilinus sp. OTU3971 TaxID=3043855 RepID=UPI00313C0560